ncbi:MAG: EamA family transporter RarD [Pseudomonadota bacterium]
MRKGILYATACYTAWGLFPIYFKAISEIPAMEILFHRMLWALLFLVMVLAWRKQWSWIPELLKKPKLIAGFAGSALLLSINWFIYIWATNNDHIVDASLGYFITPLVNVLLGYAFLHERMRPIQWWAVGLAASGVVWLTVQTGHPPWIGLSLAASFGAYGLLRKTAALGPLEGLSLETFLLFPFALAYLTFSAANGQSAFLHSAITTQLLLLAAGPITAIPLLLFAAGARRIPLATLGLLQYISPSIQLLLGVWIYHEAFSAGRLIGFATIWAGLIIYSAEGLRNAMLKEKAAT